MTAILEKLKKKKVAVWGMGNNFKSKEKFIREYINPIVYVDSNQELWGCEVLPGIICVSPEEMHMKGIEVIVLTPESGFIRNELKKKLENKYEIYILNYLWDENEIEFQKHVDFGSVSDAVVKRFTCGVGSCVCNLHCDYCILDSLKDNIKFYSEFSHDISFMIKALSKGRLGGRALFSISGGGETLMKAGIAALAYGLLAEGHYIIFTTNGTITQKIDELLAFESDMVKRMMFTCSLHYLELKRSNLLETYFENVNKIRAAGASVEMSIVGCDEYLPYIDEIMQICLNRVGFLPSPIVVRSDGNRSTEFQLDSKLDKNTYLKTWARFSETKMDAVKAVWNQISDDCYAGIHTAKLNLENGRMYLCDHDKNPIDNIYADIKRKIEFLESPHPCNMGCCNCYGIPLSGRTLSTGRVPTNYQLINRVDKNGIPTINETMRSVLDFVNE